MKHQITDDVNVNVNVDLELNNSIVEINTLVTTVAKAVVDVIVVYMAADALRHLVKKL